MRCIKIILIFNLKNMNNELIDIITYLISIRELEKWKIIKIWNNFYKYNGLKMYRVHGE